MTLPNNEKQGMRYFSSLTPIKRQNSVLDSQSQTWLLGLSDGLARAIMNNMIDELLQTRQFVDTQEIKGRNALFIKGYITH
jgi:hypothetical protein